MVWPDLAGHFEWSHWCAFYDYFEEAIGIKLIDWAVMKDHTNFGLVYPIERFVVISDRPEFLRLEDGELHCETGPAWSYTDGVCGWSIRGVAVDEQIVMRPQSQSLQQIKGEKNAEVKRIRIDQYGWERYLSDSNAKVIETTRNDIQQTTESLLRCDEMTVLICACPSTARVYSMEVDPACKTVEQAQNFLGGGNARRIIGAS